MRIRPDVELANSSDAGCEREVNEDFFLYCEPDDDTDFAHRGRLLVVTDGMGGQSGGEVASRLAAEVVRDTFLASEEKDPRQILIEGFTRAHRAILCMAEEEPELKSMGTTCCAAILRKKKLYYGHTGDSRIYLLRNGAAEQLTEDHSLVAQMVREGLITVEQAKHHRRRNVIQQALGMDSDAVSGDFPSAPLELIANDVVLLCTDGLHGLVSGQEMVHALAGQSLSDACRELVALAKVRGGPDNITVQLLAVRQRIP